MLRIWTQGYLLTFLVGQTDTILHIISGEDDILGQLLLYGLVFTLPDIEHHQQTDKDSGGKHYLIYTCREEGFLHRNLLVHPLMELLQTLFYIYVRHTHSGFHIQDVLNVFHQMTVLPHVMELLFCQLCAGVDDIDGFFHYVICLLHYFYY